MAYLLDTDHVVILQLESADLYQRLSSRLGQYSPDDFYISIVTFHEQMAGWQAFLNRRRDAQSVVRAYREFSRLLSVFADVQLAEFSPEAAAEFDSLRKQRVRIGTMDLRIAATALVRDYTVLTRNLVDFEQVPGLKVEDWTVTTPEKPR
jgi:tRNA(fMet)-specific endonuclease VapC